MRILTDSLVSRKVGDETVIIHLTTGKGYVLNRVGSEVWDGLIKGDDVATITERISRTFDESLASVMADVNALIEQMHEEKLIEQ